MGDRSEYSDTGMRGRDGREGFGDDMGTRVGRPDGAREPSQALGPNPGQPGTNRDAVPDGIEGSIMDEDAGQALGAQERRAEDHAARQDRQGDDPNRPAGDNRRVDEL